MSEEKWRYASRPRPFWPWLLGFALVLCAVGAAGLAVLWGALERYEAATPEAAILRSVKAVQDDDLKEEDVPEAMLPGRFATAGQSLWTDEEFSSLGYSWDSTFPAGGS